MCLGLSIAADAAVWLPRPGRSSDRVRVMLPPALLLCTLQSTEESAVGSFVLRMLNEHYHRVHFVLWTIVLRSHLMSCDPAPSSTLLRTAPADDSESSTTTITVCAQHAQLRLVAPLCNSVITNARREPNPALTMSGVAMH